MGFQLGGMRSLGGKELKVSGTSFMARVQQADQWVNSLRKWAADHHVQSKLGFTFVPVLEDEFTSQKAYSNLVDAIRSQQAKDNSPTALRRSMNGSNSQDFRISGVSMEFHGSWSDAKTKVLSGDTWSNDGTVYGINGAKAGANNNFVSDAKEAKRKGVSVLYWNSDMNGTEKKDTNWASRPLSVFSGTTASANKARLTLVLEI